MAEIEVEESFETTTVRRKTVRQSIKIEEVSNVPKMYYLEPLEISLERGKILAMTSTSKFDAQRATDCCNIYEKTYRFVISFQQSLMRVVAHIYKDFLVLKRLFP